MLIYSKALIDGEKAIIINSYNLSISSTLNPVVLEINTTSILAFSSSHGLRGNSYLLCELLI